MKETLIEPNIDGFNNYINNNKDEYNIFHSFFFFKYLNLLKLAKKRKIKFEDIKCFNKENENNSIIQNESYNYLKKGTRILNSLIRHNKYKIFYIIFLSILRIILIILIPFLFKQFSKSDVNIFGLIVSILFIDYFRTSLSLKIELNSNELSLLIDNQIKHVIIKNDLLNKKENENKTTNEKISTCNIIFNNDIETLKQFFYLFPNFFSIPLLIFSYYIVLYLLFGLTGLISFLLLIVFIFINLHLQGKLKQGQKNKQKAIEDRMIFMTNLIYNLKNIKILLYEKFFYKKIIEKRNSELNKYEILYQTANKIRSLLWASPTLLILLTIVCHIIFCLYNNIKIKIENLVIIFGLIDSLQQPILTFCQTYSSYLISNISANRIEKYLSETNSDKTIANKNENKVNDINFQNNEIVFIIGDTGSGKSYLLKQIYNNYKNNINNNIHLIYNGQESFILNDTIQSNIFFMKDKNSIDKFKYLEIIKNSCLENDLSLMEKGDMTQAGEGGCCLSGGQKKRICISRALLEAESNKSQKQILFFDEPTYSLDPETLNTVWENCFIDFLKETTRIIATNNLDLLRYSNKIIYVENKEIIFFGDYSEFKNNKDIYDKYLKLDTLFKKRKQEIKDNLNFSIRDNNNNFAQSKSNNNISAKKIINQNERNNIQIYRKFIQILIGGYINFFLLLFILIIWIILRFFSEYFLFIFKNESNSKISFHKLITLYIIINIFACLLLYLRLVLTSKYTISGGRNLHEMMLDPIINTPIKYVQKKANTNQLINNFSRDLGMVDFFSSVMFGNCLTFGGAFISLLIVIIKFFKIFLVFVPIFIIIGFFFTNLYLEGFRQLIQLENQMRTNIINFIKEMNLGKEEIQSYKINDKFLFMFKELYKKFYLSHITVKNSNAWFLYSISRMSFILKLFFMLYFYYQIKKDNFHIIQDKIGILFISIFSIHEYFNRFLSHVVTFQNSLMAFNRCLSCTNINNENIEINLSPNIKDKSIFSDGLKKEIKFDNVCIKYNKEGENVLKNITFKIKKGEKIGICGKTGVGKTTLLMSLLKFVDINEGNIIFDENIDINKIDINILRKNIICITQDINLFDELTIKENIDPYDKYSKNDIEKILENYSFKEFINYDSNKKSTLNLDKIFDVKVKDLKFSFGQKNIICLIRAILRFDENKNSIILIDEMVDKNDFFISDKIMDLLINKLKDGTILIVTHRMNSLNNCDKILVLENGNLAEFDTPEKLLSNQNSLFYKYNIL